MKKLQKQPITQAEVNQKVRQTMKRVIYNQLIIGVILISILMLSYFYFPFFDDLDTVGNRIGSMIGSIIATCMATITYHCMYQHMCHQYQQEFNESKAGGRSGSTESPHTFINQSAQTTNNEKGATDMKKYTLLKHKKIINNGIVLYRIQCVNDFMMADGREIKAGDLGGYLESEHNLSHYRKAWGSDNAQVYGKSSVNGNALVCDDASISGDVYLSENAIVCENASLSDDARVSGDAQVCGNAKICDNAIVSGDVRVSENATISGNAMVFDHVRVSGNAIISGRSSLSGSIKVQGDARVCGNASIWDDRHLFTMSPIGEKAEPITIFKSNHGNMEIVFAGKLYSVCAFKSLVEGWSPHFQEIAKQALETAKKSMDYYD